MAGVATGGDGLGGAGWVGGPALVLAPMPGQGSVLYAGPAAGCTLTANTKKGVCCMSASYDDAQILLRCAELFQAMNLGETSGWVHGEDFPDGYAAFVADHPQGSERYGELMRYAGYYETLATLWKHQLFDEDLLFDWMLVPWNRVGVVLLGIRETMDEPRMWENFEALGAAQDRWDGSHS